MKEADSFQQKVQLIAQNGIDRSGSERLTPITQGEVNSYLRFHAGDQIPAGVTEPLIGILGDGRLEGSAVVDLDAVRLKRSSGGWLDPMSYLTGKLPLTATGILHTRAGLGKFELESAAISGITVPKMVLQEVLTYYSRTPDNPQGINLDDSFELPVEIREIRVGKGNAIVVQ
jgi:hypothetical protein